MDICKIVSAATLLIISSTSCYAGHTGKIRFIGIVVESGCWNVLAKNDMYCFRNNTVTHYSIATEDITPLDVSNAIVKKTFLDNDKKLELLRVDYN